MIQKFRKKPVVIEAVQYNNLNRSESNGGGMVSWGLETDNLPN